MKVLVNGRRKNFRTVSFDKTKNAVLLIEQRLLPHEFKVIATPNFRKTAEAITNMTVRGAGAIGATAAYGLAQGVRAFRGKDVGKFNAHAQTVFQTLADARPTAVDPVNAMKDILRQMEQGSNIAEKQNIALAGAHRFADEDVEHCEAIGAHGSHLIQDGMNVLTHCNAGWLAFVDIGSATAPMYCAQAEGRAFHVFCDETRPRSQGASLTAWELAQQKVSHDVIADNAAGHLMQHGEIDLVIVGSDRVVGRSGDVANKVGTYTKAVLARRHKIPFYVAIPLSTIDWSLKRGLEIPIEERDDSEILGAWGVNSRGKREYVRVANPGSTGRNPAFDVTPASLITGIITPMGIYKPKELWPNRERLGCG